MENSKSIIYRDLTSLVWHSDGQIIISFTIICSSDQLLIFHDHVIPKHRCHKFYHVAAYPCCTDRWKQGGWGQCSQHYANSQFKHHSKSTPSLSTTKAVHSIRTRSQAVFKFINCKVPQNYDISSLEF